jgi:S-adenosyl-L-methionine hydrolase (adenosine-forming)
MPKIITLTTDFGHQDPFVGIMKGVVLSVSPEARIVDLCHEVAPQDLLGAALRLESALPYFPDGTVHLVVVDPGVGTDRAAIAVRTARAFFVGPDNGVIPAAIERFEAIDAAVRLTNTDRHLRPTSKTFHGRDIFAPCAALLSLGVPIAELGEPAGELVALYQPLPEPVGNVWHAHVIGRDRFGNLLTDLRAEHLQRSGEHVMEIRIGGERAPVRETYGDVPEGDLVAYIGSSGRLEIAVRNGSAAERLGPVVTLTVQPTEDPLSPE